MERWATFDCYGTLVDWDAGMRRALRGLGFNPVTAAALLQGYHRHEPTVQTEAGFRPYRDVLGEALRRSAEDAHVALHEDDVFARTLPSWPVFEDVKTALTQLQEAGWRLGILSNVDNDLIQLTVAQWGDAFDCIVTAEEVGSYKPDLGHFKEFRRRTGVGADQWVHVACSSHHDVAPAHKMELKTVFVRRGFDPDPEEPASRTIDGLTTLPDTLDVLVPPSTA